MTEAIYRMSEAGHCPRALSAKRLGLEPEPTPDWLTVAASEGNWHEKRIKQGLTDIGYRVWAEQAELSISKNGITLVGHIDGKVAHPDDDNEVKLLECKSMSQFEFDRWMRGRFEEFPEYADQLTCYMAASQISKVLYCVKNRSSGYLDTMEIDRTPSDFGTIWERLYSIEQHIATKGLYPAECDFSTLRCKRCQFKYVCVKAKEDMTIQQENVLHDAAKKWRQGKELEASGKALVDEAKEVFREHTYAANLKKWRFDSLAIVLVGVKEHVVPERLQKAYEYIKIDDTLSR